MTLPPFAGIDFDVQRAARAFADGHISGTELSAWLVGRVSLVDDPLEVDLWGVCALVEAGEMRVADARAWLSHRLRLDYAD